MKVIQQEIKDLERDPANQVVLENHKLQLALYLSCEPTIEELINHPLTVSKASLHKYILMDSKRLPLNTKKKSKKTKILRESALILN